MFFSFVCQKNERKKKGRIFLPAPKESFGPAGRDTAAAFGGIELG